MKNSILTCVKDSAHRRDQTFSSMTGSKCVDLFLKDVSYTGTHILHVFRGGNEKDRDSYVATPAH